MDNTTIKDNIRKIRKGQKITQEEMALKLGISLTAYRDLEKGHTSVLNSNLLKIADILDTTTEEIVLGYKPAQIETTTLQDVRAEYSNKVNILERRVLDLEKLVESYEETVKSKSEIIDMLKKKLDEDK